MKRQRIVLNALTTTGQTLGSAATLFVLYRFLIRTIGVERLGIWSLVLATTSVVWLANQGFSSSLVKFVAKYAAREREHQISLVIQTAVISIAAAVALLSCGLYPFAQWVLALVLPAKSFPEAHAILPFALISLWLTVLESILQAGLTGNEFIAECNYLDMGGSLSYLLLAVALVPSHGLLGLAYAQVAQIAVIVLITWALLRRRVGLLPLIPYRWSRDHCRELLGYGLHFQLITASQALREPLTKALITKFGGLACTGFYDLAARAVITVRETIVQANQVLIPTVAHLHEREPETIPVIYRESYRLVFFLAVPAFACLTIGSPLLSKLWIGHYEPIFVEFIAILSAGWLVNVLANPAYVAFLGTGELQWVSVGCIATLILNAVFSYAAGRLAMAPGLSGLAVVLVASASFAAGYVIVLAAYHLENRVPFRQLLPQDSVPISVASFASIALVLGICTIRIPSVKSTHITTAVLALLLTFILGSMWRHPMRTRLLRWVFSRAPA